MAQNTGLECFDSARFALKSWQPVDKTSNELKNQMLEFLDISEQEQNSLRNRYEASSAEQKQIEMALCYTEDAISITSADGSIRLVNPAFERLIGYYGYELIDSDQGRLWNYLDIEKVEEVNAVTSSGCDWIGELRLKSRSGACFDVQASVVPIIHYMGELTHLVFTFHNVTRQNQLEKDLNRQKQFLEKVINLNPSIIIILDENGDWMLDNLAAKTLLSDMGKGARATLSSLIMSQIKGDKQNNSEKIRLTMANKSQMTLMLISEEIPAKYLIPEIEKKELFLITLSDITENERKNSEILIQQKALIASRIEKNMIQGEFISGFVYRMQKPLNVMKAAISRIQNAVQQTNLDQIEQVNFLLHHELLFFEEELIKFRSLQQSYPESQESTEASELSAAIRILYPIPYQAGNIEFRYDSDEPVIYPLPYEIMQLILKILIDNSIESASAISKEIMINIRFQNKGSGSLLVVEDNGLGIAKDFKYKVFEPFYSTKQNRSGLSLTILHQLLNSINGSVDISYSKLGGVKMVLYFPLETL